MTVIAAASWNGQSAIACDSAGTDGAWTQQGYGSKIRKHRFGWAGYAGSYRVMKAAHDELEKIKVLDDETAFDLSQAFFESMQSLGWSGSSSSGPAECKGLCAVLATKEGLLYTVQSDFAILRCDGIASVGCGDQTALGALYALRQEGATDALGAATLAVEASIALNAGCGGEIHTERWKHKIRK